MIYYATVALAEQAIIDAGYRRDAARALWVNPEGKTAKVVHEAGKFYVQRS